MSGARGHLNFKADSAFLNSGKDTLETELFSRVNCTRFQGFSTIRLKAIMLKFFFKMKFFFFGDINLQILTGLIEKVFSL